MSCNYVSISDFGQSAGLSPQNDPLSYCALSGLESGFQHTIGGGNSLVGPNSGQCQTFMAQYCAQGPNGWDGVCEYLSNDSNTMYPNMVSTCNRPDGACMGSGIGNFTSKGQILIRNTAQEKYISKMSDNCQRVYQPFDPTVADSPLISKWMPVGNDCKGNGSCRAFGTTCIPIYDVDAKKIDSDVVMDKILQQPWIALDILANIYNYRKRGGTLRELDGTKIGTYFKTKDFQRVLKTNSY